MRGLDIFSVEKGNLTYTAGPGKNETFELAVGQDQKMTFHFRHDSIRHWLYNETIESVFGNTPEEAAQRACDTWGSQILFVDPKPQHESSKRSSK